MASAHGKDAYMQLANQSDSLTTFTTQITNIKWNPSKKISDSTAMGATAKENIDGQKDASFTVDGFVDSSTTALIRALYWAVGVSKSFIIGPEGSTAGMQRLTGTAICTSLNIKPNIDGVVPFSASFVTNAAWTEDTF